MTIRKKSLKNRAINATSHPCSEWNHTQMLADFGTGGADWNDQLLVENCRRHGISPLTNDGDFTEGGISVFTANNKLLVACP